jgi:hypothetical protein
MSPNRQYDLDLDEIYLGYKDSLSETNYSGQDWAALAMADFKYNVMPDSNNKTISTSTNDASLVCYSYYDFNTNQTKYTNPSFLASSQASTGNTTVPTDDSNLKSKGVTDLATLLDKYDGLSAYTYVSPGGLTTYEQYFYDTLNAIKDAWKAKTGMTLSPYCLGLANNDGSANTYLGADGNTTNSAANTTGAVAGSISTDQLAKNSTRNNQRIITTSALTSLLTSTNVNENAVAAINLQSGTISVVNIADPDYTKTNGSTNGNPCVVTYYSNADNKVIRMSSANTNNGVRGACSIVVVKQPTQTAWYLVGPNTSHNNVTNETYQYCRAYTQSGFDYTPYQNLVTRLYQDAVTILEWALGKYDTDGSVRKWIKDNGMGIIENPWGCTYVFQDYYNYSNDSMQDMFLQYSSRYNKDLVVFKSDILGGAIKPKEDEY